MEKTFRVEPFATLLFCDKCGMQVTEISHNYLTNPMQFCYKCSKCGWEIVTTKSYPVNFCKIIEEVKDNNQTAYEDKGE